jgi:hypothetical protein
MTTAFAARTLSRKTDLAFALRLLAEEGLSYRFVSVLPSPVT